LLVYARGDGKTIEKGELLSVQRAHAICRPGADGIADDVKCKDGQEGETQRVFQPGGFYYTAGPTAEIVRVKNSGNTDWPVSVYTEYNNVLGGGLYTKTATKTVTVLPDSTRAIVDKLDAEVKDSSDKVTTKAAPAFGLFWATTHVNFLNEDHVVRHLVLICPVWLLVLLIVVVLAAIGLIVLKIMQHKNRKGKHVNRKKRGLRIA
jgi:hypothetical protein